MVGETVARMTYGFTSYSVESARDGGAEGREESAKGTMDYIEMAERAQAHFSIAAIPNTYWVDFIPLRSSFFVEPTTKADCA